MRCEQCGAAMTKHGRNPSGSQKDWCPVRRTIQTPRPTPTDVDAATRLRAIALVLDGSSFRAARRAKQCHGAGVVRLGGRAAPTAQPHRGKPFLSATFFLLETIGEESGG